jgi:hypothetical protein
MKPINEILSLDTVDRLPTSDSLAAVATRIEELETIPTMLEFQTMNIPYEDLNTLLEGCSGMLFNGTQQATITQKLKKLKPSTNTFLTTTEFI